MRLGAGGGSRAKTNWLSVVGLVRADTARVTIETDRFENRAVRLEAPPGFPWKAFALAPSRSDRPLSVRARDAAGGVLQRVDLSWGFRAPCEERRKGCRTRAHRRGRWSAARDPLAAGQTPFIRGGGGARSKRIATDHPAVRQVVAGQPFSFDRVAHWGDVIGFRVYVDLNRKRVVGISPEDDSLDGREGGRPPPAIDYTVVQPLRPAGGRDSGDCESKPGE